MGRLPTIGVSDEVTFALRSDMIADRMAPNVAKGGVLSQALVRTMYVARRSRQAEAQARHYVGSVQRLLKDVLPPVR
jgi:hypothetical protein